TDVAGRLDADDLVAGGGRDHRRGRIEHTHHFCHLTETPSAKTSAERPIFIGVPPSAASCTHPGTHPDCIDKSPKMWYTLTVFPCRNFTSRHIKSISSRRIAFRRHSAPASSCCRRQLHRPSLAVSICCCRRGAAAALPAQR